MIEGKPGIPLPVLFEVLLLTGNDLQRKIIIGHDPEGIDMSMGGKKIAKMDGTFTARGNLY